MVWQTRVNTTTHLHCILVASSSGSMTLSTTSSPDFLKKKVSHFILSPEPASPPLPQAILHQSDAFPAPGRVLNGSQIILLLSLDLTHFYFNVWPADLQGKMFFWSEFSLSYWGALKVSFFFIPAHSTLTGHMKQGVRLGLTFSIFPLIR